jgi:hypothetical protein
MITVTLDFALLEARRGAVWGLFSDMLQADFGVGMVAGVEYALRRTLEAESSLPVTATMKLGRLAAVAGIRPAPVRFQLCEMLRSAPAGVCGEDRGGARSSVCGLSLLNGWA